MLEELNCRTCGKVANLVDGIPTFSPALAYEGEGFKEEYFNDLFKAEAENFWFRGRNRLILWSLKKFAPNFTKLLEIGCGTGFVLNAITQAYPGRTILGSEVFVAGLKFATARLPRTQLIQMDARAIPFKDEFDVIGAFDVLEHIEDDRTVLREVARSLKPGGHLLLTVPQHPWLWSQSDTYAKHQRRYTKRGLHGKLKDAGFTIIRSTSFVSLLIPALILSRLLDRIRPSSSYDPMREMALPRTLNSAFESLLTLELHLIRLGLSLPFGGTRLVVAKKLDGKLVE